MHYRPEIDGLRALAVIPVVLFHAGFASFSGGFVGVDVFFVISGYLITSIILAEQHAGKFTIAGFYERRARRILPALFVVMLVCLPFAWLWLLPHELKEFSESLVAVSLFSSNILFWSQSGYFDTGTELKPLLHTWSLAAEEQYYLLFPPLLILTARVKTRRLLAVFAAIAVASLALAQWGSRHAPEATFYLLPARAWELLIGVFVAYYFAAKDRAPQAPMNGPLSESGSLAGLLLIVYSIVAFDKGTAFPSAYALVPTVGAALVILCANPQTLVGKLLGSRALMGMGLISYSVYLWHQPLFAFARYRSSEPPGAAMLLALAVLAVVLGWLSWKYVETPLRSRRLLARKQVFLASGAIGVLFLSLGMGVYFNRGFANRAGPLETIAAIKTVQNSRCHLAERRTAQQIAHGDICTLGSGNVTPSFAVMGDSHAGAVFEALHAYHGPRPFAFYAISDGFCAPFLNGYQWDKNHHSDCAATMEAGFKQVLDTPEITDIVLVAEWANYTTGTRDVGHGIVELPLLSADAEGAANSVLDNALVFERSLVKTVEALRKKGKHVIIVKSVPEFHQAVIPTISKHILWQGAASDMTAFAPRIGVESYRQRNAMVTAAWARLGGVSFVETESIFCHDRECRSMGKDGDILFSDTNHLTEDGAQLLVGEIMRQLGLGEPAGSPPPAGPISAGI